MAEFRGSIHKHRALGRPTEGWPNGLLQSLVVLILLVTGSLHALGSQYVSDTTTTNPPQGVVRDRLGARLVFGGVYAFADQVVVAQGLEDVHTEFYGVKVGALLPIGAQVDFMAVGEYTMSPEGTYTTYTVDYSSSSVYWMPMQATQGKVPSSNYLGFRIGLRIYPRFMKHDNIIALARGLQRPLWRRRVNRSGFYGGFSTGPVLGLHKRVTRALPEIWPQNESVPESALLQYEQSYKRWYWSTSPELGWTFMGRLDVSAGIMWVLSFEGYTKSPYEIASRAYAGRVYVTGSLSFILGRTKLKSQ